MSEYTFQFQGKSWSYEDLISNPEYRSRKDTVIVPGAAIRQPGIVHIFDSVEDFRSWSDGAMLVDEFDRIDERVQPLRQMENTSAPEIEAYKDRVASIAENLTELSVTTLSMGQAGFWEHINFGGAFLPYPGAPIPHLHWIGWGDKISSARVSGTIILFEHSFFRGRKLVLAGMPFQEFPDFRNFDFSDKASSIGF